MLVLKNDFYTIKEKVQVSETQISVVIELNESHAIYEGHFPLQPIVPGVCQIQIIKELLEDLSGKKLQMVNGDNIKFTGMIIPSQSSVINVDLSYQFKEAVLACDAKLYFGEIIFTKYKGKFKIL